MIHLFSLCCVCLVLAAAHYSGMPSHPAVCRAFPSVSLCSAPSHTHTGLHSHMYFAIFLCHSFSSAVFCCRRRWAALFRAFPKGSIRIFVSEVEPLLHFLGMTQFPSSWKGRRSRSKEERRLTTSYWIDGSLCFTS